MSDGLSLYRGDFFSETSFRQGDQLLSFRFQNSRWPLSKILAFVKLKWSFEPKHIRLCLDDLKSALLMNSVEPSALITNQGFEDWLKLSWPEAEDEATFDPRKLINSDLCFGVSQRDNSEGKAEKELSTEDIDFLVAKLKMVNAQQVALALLNSHKNPNAEMLIAERLGKEGFRVFCSSEVPISSEKERWSWALLSATLDPIFQSLNEELMLTLEELNWTPELYIYTRNGLEKLENKMVWADALLGAEHLIDQKRQSSDFVYFGLESFFESFDQEAQRPSPPWHFVPKHISWPKMRRSLLQPSLLLSEGPFKTLIWSSKEAGFEPGPICFGKGLRLTWLDLLATSLGTQQLSEIYDIKINDTVSRIREQLIQVAPAGFSRKDLPDLEHQLLNEGLFLLSKSMQQPSERPVTLAGPLAQILCPRIKNSQIHHNRLQFLSEPLLEENLR